SELPSSPASVDCGATFTSKLPLARATVCSCKLRNGLNYKLPRNAPSAQIDTDGSAARLLGCSATRLLGYSGTRLLGHIGRAADSRYRRRHSRKGCAVAAPSELREYPTPGIPVSGYSSGAGW